MLLKARRHQISFPLIDYRINFKVSLLPITTTIIVSALPLLLIAVPLPLIADVQIIIVLIFFITTKDYSYILLLYVRTSLGRDIIYFVTLFESGSDV